MLNHLLPAALFATLTAFPAFAESFERIDERDEFVGTIAGRELRMGLFGISLLVEPDGQIKGRAMGWDLTGTWDWKDGYFCREMDWSGYAIPMNCQLVEAKGTQQIRFTVDRGAGDAASFSLR
jgi:hypothetical protein